MSIPKYGEIKCQAIYKSGEKKGKQCTNGAYYSSQEQYYCGTHSKKDNRVKLEKVSKNQANNLKEKQREKMFIDAKNHRSSKGQVTLNLFRSMYRKPDIVTGWINVYPNYKTGWQGIGLVLPELSPMSLGPIHHNQKGLPPALLLENFHQGSKRFKNESEKEFEENRYKYFTDTEPHRHKYKGDDEGGNPNSPLYFVWNDHKLDYIQSRQFYCNYYERLASKTEGFKLLKTLYNEGYHLKICGPDAYNIERDEDIESEYLNPRYPFGHERVLYTMLTMDDVNNYPWRKHKTFDF